MTPLAISFFADLILLSVICPLSSAFASRLEGYFEACASSRDAPRLSWAALASYGNVLYDFRTHSHFSFGLGAEGQISPDGKWLAFIGPGMDYQDSDVFIAQFPKPGGRVQVSNHGGAQARWRADGKKLFYISADKKLMAVSIDTAGGRVVAGVPHMLFQTRIIAPRIVLFQYAVSPDGKRFLINSLPSVGASPLTVLMN